jgi:FkbM family methyltransferase
LAQDKCFFWGYKERTRVENVAVSDGADDRLWLFPGRWRCSQEWNIMGHDVLGNKTGPELEIPATSLDMYFPKGARLDFVKIDVEGAEAKVLAGMSRLLRESRPLALVEFHSEAGWAGREHLMAAGYYLYDMNNRKLAPDSQCVYHVLALPEERSV